MDLAPLTTARLRLEPVTAEMARAIIAGDMSVLAAAGLSRPRAGRTRTPPTAWA